MELIRLLAEHGLSFMRPISPHEFYRETLGNTHQNQWFLGVDPYFRQVLGLGVFQYPQILGSGALEARTETGI